MSYNPAIHHRRSIRLKGYDYSQAGLYFVTICCQNKICYFGNIENDKMFLNDAGRMVEKWCMELSHKFSDIELDTYIIMPNHFHAIIVNNGNNAAVGADLRVCPDKHNNILGEHDNVLGEHNNVLGEHDIILGEHNIILGEHNNVLGEHNNALGEHNNILGEHNNVLGEHNNVLGEHNNVLGEHNNVLGEHNNVLGEHDNILGEHIGSPLHVVVQWFKTMTTNEYIRGVKTLGWQPFDKKLWQRNYWEHIIRHEQSYQRIANYIINNPANWKNDKFYNSTER